MKKILLLIFISLFVSNIAVTQNNENKKKKPTKNRDKVLHFGASIFYAKQYMDMGDYFNDGFEYYFANEKNETIKSNITFDDKSTSNFPIYPNIYAKLNYGNHLFFRLDFFSFWFSNTMTLRNSVDAGDFYSAYSESDFNEDSDDNYLSNDETDYKSMGYNELKINWMFTGNNLIAGYSFMKNKSFQPFLMGGFSVMYLMIFQEANYTSQRSHRNDVIFSEIDTYSLISFYPLVGAGVKHRGLSLEFSFQFSNNVDINKENEQGNYNENYTGFQMFRIALGINLFSKNLNKNKLLK